MPEELQPSEPLAAICLVLGLRAAEGRILMSLMAHGLRTQDQIRAVIAQPAVSIGTMSATIYTLRKKLKRHGIKVTNIPKLGYMLDTKSRDRIQKLITEYDAAIVPMRIRPETVEPDVCA
jgi:DNA-binding winged helix-turn-helix (wHTH) protein